MRKIISILIFTFIIVNVVGFIVFLKGGQQTTANRNNILNNSVNMKNNSSDLGKISLAVLFEHNNAEDCWIGYKGKVYDLTLWLPKHPGSAEAISPFCGTAAEFERAFENQHGNSQVGKLFREGIYKGELQ